MLFLSNTHEIWGGMVQFPALFLVDCSSQLLILVTNCSFTHHWVWVLLMLPESYSTVAAHGQFIHWLITAWEDISNFSTLLGTHACPDTWIHCTWCVLQKISRSLVPIVSWPEFLLCEHKRNNPVGWDYYVIVPTDAFGLCHSRQSIHLILISSSQIL